MAAREGPSYRVVGDRVVPDWLTPVDHPWLERLLSVAAAADGHRWVDVEERLLAVPGPTDRVRMAAEALLAAAVVERPGAEARRWREAIFLAGATMARAEAIGSVGLPEDELWRRAFADLPGERRYRAPALPGASELAQRTNLRLVQALVQRAVGLEITLSGNARDVVRHVRRQGLLCVARPVPGGVRLEVSGVFSLFRRTTLYGRALASVVPRLRWCERFLLEARVVLGARELLLKHGPGDPVWPSEPPRAFDSRLEAAFARDLAKRFPEWDTVREPEAVEADGRLVFPDFAIWRRSEPGVRWLVEIAGFWTPGYLRAKLGGLAAAGLRGMVVCVDAARNVGEGELPPGLALVPFTRRVDVAEVVAAALRIPAGTERSGVATAKLGLGDLFLDFAGQHPYDAALHGKLARLRVGDLVDVVAADGGVFVAVDGVRVAALSRRAREAWVGREVLGARVTALVERSSVQTQSAWRGRLRVDRWWVPLVEVTWVSSAVEVPCLVGSAGAGTSRGER